MPGMSTPPDRGGFSAPSQLSNFSNLCICQRMFLSSLAAPRYSRAGRGEGSAHQRKASKEIKQGMQQLIGNAAGPWRWGGFTGLLEVGGRAVPRWSWRKVPEPSEEGEGPTGTEWAVAGQENH